MCLVLKFVNHRVFACTLVNIIAVWRTNQASFGQKFWQSRSGAVQRVAALKVGGRGGVWSSPRNFARVWNEGQTFQTFSLICISQVYLGRCVLSDSLFETGMDWSGIGYDWWQVDREKWCIAILQYAISQYDAILHHLQSAYAHNTLLCLHLKPRF